jgi:hypothetical protein
MWVRSCPPRRFPHCRSSSSPRPNPTPHLASVQLLLLSSIQLLPSLIVGLASPLPHRRSNSPPPLPPVQLLPLLSVQFLPTASGLLFLCPPRVAPLVIERRCGEEGNYASMRALLPPPWTMRSRMRALLECYSVPGCAHLHMRGRMRALLKLALYVHNLDHRCMIQQPIFKVFTFPTFDVILHRICARNYCGFLFARATSLSQA